jgi:(p)ppGpp synthase/HD superfamily hydrolase
MKNPVELLTSNFVLNAYKLAELNHRTQKYGDKPYLTHLMGVASFAKNENEIIVSLLHDILEDTKIKVSDLSDFPKNIVNTIVILTKSELEYKIKYEKIEIASVNIPIEYINVKTKQKEYSMNPAVQQIQEMLQKDVEEAEKKHKKWLGIF